MTLFCIYIWRWGFWLRIFGVGFYLAVDNKLPPLFSERQGYKKVYRFWGFKFKWLPREKGY